MQRLLPRVQQEEQHSQPRPDTHRFQAVQVQRVPKCLRLEVKHHQAHDTGPQQEASA